MARYLTQRSKTNVNPPFFSDLLEILEDRRQKPNQVLIVSLEDDDDVNCTRFWSIPQIYQTTMNRCKIVRIYRELQATNYMIFTEQYPVSSLPTIFVFGQNSTVPTFTFSGHIPNPFEFIAQFNSLNPPTITYTQLSTADPQVNEYDPFAEELHSRNPENTTKTTPAPKMEFADEEYVDPYLAPRPKPKPASTKTPNTQPAQPKPKLTVTVDLPDGQQAHNDFSVTQPLFIVHKWLITLVPPNAEFKVYVLPSNEEFSDSQFDNLSKYLPSLHLKIVIQRKPFPKLKLPGLSKIKEWWDYISPFATKDDDYMDFHRPNQQPVHRARHI
ncbi:hypothetical protein TVAG_388600 [Trichomonas vaginalis G3]|uniref:UBX domain-containing protein n=1 Tax=Trichomonas vaginalis (strain ATCC PRA-98 / G3) TaxID=412133 RepID=A2DYJ3_TRIV3|nr:hypothetical protein TVAGG3_0321050 [Trichomonas vaginalis G3]EAY14528.1 hypothetical protein TVAG_388600 [Trichomonas vaginalis G3]KAI5529298.1 hypothetical protein TVAGG3_0321050 [Trichomonas vaginalis G3]|eukprot:XP_001326751.1 hypothetical protein [Trichomonas vaginalis G3]